jgi:hypothetical protein
MQGRYMAPGHEKRNSNLWRQLLAEERNFSGWNEWKKQP